MRLTLDVIWKLWLAGYVLVMIVSLAEFVWFNR